MHAGPVGPLPRQLDIRRLAAAETSVEAVEPLTSFPRLTAQLLDPEGEVAIVLHFSSDEQRRWIIRGQVKAELAIPCQRCLQPMPLEIDAHFAVGVVEDDEAARQLPGELEPYIAGQGMWDLRDLVEDELLLNLPYTSYHDEEECAGLARYSTGQVEEEDSPRRKDNPFQQLEQLKLGKTRRDND